jgi:FixJ family two-component response regulator
MTDNRTSSPVLLGAIRDAVERSRVALARASELRALHERYRLLTSRQREDMALVVTGLLNKQVAGRLAITEITVKGLTLRRRY